MRAVMETFGDARAAALIAWLLQWGRRGQQDVAQAEDQSAVRDWRVFQERSADQDWTVALTPVGSGLPVRALALERFLREVFVLLDTWHHRSG